MIVTPSIIPFGKRLFLRLDPVSFLAIARCGPSSGLARNGIKIAQFGASIASSALVAFWSKFRMFVRLEVRKTCY
jgi:hypothetical protein